MPDSNSPVCCPRCRWIGFFSEGLVCPHCPDNVGLQKLGQKGLDGLRREHALLLKPGYQQPPEGRDERRAQLERFFEALDNPPKTLSETTQRFREMMLSGRINALMSEGVKEGIAATEAMRSRKTSS